MKGQQTILVVDDSPTIRKIIRIELEKANYKVIEALNGAEALVKATKHLPDLITLDVDMPELDGFETSQKLGEDNYSCHFTHKENGHIPIVFVTSHDTLEIRNKGFKAGATDFITKPFKEGDIRAVVDHILKPEMPLKGLMALVVDDSKTARKIVSGVLEREGLKIIEAKDGAEALEIVIEKHGEIDLILTDLEMPEIDGVEFCKKVRNELDLVDLPIIFLTAVSDRSNLLRVFKAGGTDYLVKPFIKEELMARISVHLGSALLTKTLRETVDSLKKANEEIKFLSITDPLTGCYNRGYLSGQIQKEIERARRYKRSLSVIMCDIDHFKKINDTYGHQVGDRVLKEFVNCIREIIRDKTDWLIRYGGEEFLIILPETDSIGAGCLGERIRTAVANMPIDVDGIEIKITASFGGTGFGAKAKGNEFFYEKMINQADDLLYKAKKEGRNRVMVAMFEPD